MINSGNIEVKLNHSYVSPAQFSSKLIRLTFLIYVTYGHKFGQET